MNAALSRTDCAGCPGRVVCHCLRVTEDVVVTAIETLELRSLKELREHTGAGDGCTACHRELRWYLERQQQEPEVALAAQPSSSSCSPI